MVWKGNGYICPLCSLKKEATQPHPSTLQLLHLVIILSKQHFVWARHEGEKPNERACKIGIVLLLHIYSVDVLSWFLYGTDGRRSPTDFAQKCPWCQQKIKCFIFKNKKEVNLNVIAVFGCVKSGWWKQWCQLCQVNCQLQRTFNILSRVYLIYILCTVTYLFRIYLVHYWWWETPLDTVSNLLYLINQSVWSQLRQICCTY